MKGSAGVEYVMVGGIQLRKDEDDLVVEVEYDGIWIELFREGVEGPIHHTCHANGIVHRFECNGIVPDTSGRNGATKQERP